MADLTSVLVMAVFMMLSSFASVQGYPSRPSHPNAGYEDLLVRIEQALGRLSNYEEFPETDTYGDMSMGLQQNQGNI